MEEKDRAREQALLQLASVKEMTERLEHARECNVMVCSKASREIESPAECHDEDAAREAIENDALDVQVRSGWVSLNRSAMEDPMQPEQYTILLCTGGPAVRIKGTLDQGVPDTAQLEYQDWGTPWTRLTDLTDKDIAMLLYYADCFNFNQD